MNTIVYYGPNDFRLEDKPVPEIAPDEALIEVKACGLCSTDVWKAIYSRAEVGTVLGHELSGDVVELGSEVGGLQVGDRVAVYHRAECGSCYHCDHGQEPLCKQYRQQSIHPGAFTEYLRASPRLIEKSVIKISDGMTYGEAAMLEPTACAVRTVSKCGVTLGDRVLVMGDGPLGVLNAQVSKSAGASSVILSGHHDSRIEAAKRLGADHVFNSKRIDALGRVVELTGGRGVDIVIVAVASTGAVDEALKIVRKGGKVCVFGDFRDVPQPNLDLDLKLVLRDHIDVVGSWGCSTKNYRLAFELVRSGQVRVKEMITHRFPLDRFKEALQAFTGKECLKVILNP